MYKGSFPAPSGTTWSIFLMMKTIIPWPEELPGVKTRDLIFLINSGFELWDVESWRMVSGFGSRVSGPGFRILGLRFRIYHDMSGGRTYHGAKSEIIRFTTQITTRVSARLLHTEREGIRKRSDASMDRKRGNIWSTS